MRSVAYTCKGNLKMVVIVVIRIEKRFDKNRDIFAFAK